MPLKFYVSKNMETSTYVYIALVSTCILFVFLIILQIFWIRSKLSAIEHRERNKDLVMRSEVADKMNVKNRLQMYSLLVDCRSTGVLNNSSFKYFKELKPHFAPKIITLPYVCESGVWSKKTSIDKAGILVTDANHGAFSLQEDVLQDLIKYVVINGQMFIVDMPRDNVLKDKIREFEINNVSDKIDDRCIFVLYPVKSRYNTMIDLEGDKCTMEINTFLGSISTLDNDQTDHFDMGYVIGFGKSTSMMPTHVLGYKLP